MKTVRHFKAKKRWTTTDDNLINKIIVLKSKRLTTYDYNYLALSTDRTVTAVKQRVTYLRHKPKKPYISYKQKMLDYSRPEFQSPKVEVVTKPLPKFCKTIKTRLEKIMDAICGRI